MNNMLHTKLLLSSTTLLMTLSSPSFAADLELKPISDLSASYQVARACFLPDCGEDGSTGDINMNINNDTRWCEKKGYTYYSSGECPQYYKKTDTCKKDNHYLKCDAAAWCKDNGYNTTSCSLPKFVDTQCPNGQELYKTCTTDNPRACKQLGYTNSCPSGQKLKQNSGRCSYDNAFGTCCTPKGCPSQYGLSPSCTQTPANGHDGCEYTCYKCCSDECPTSGTSKSYSGSTARSTECGSTCRYFRSCPSGASTSYHGSSAGYDDNGKWCGNYCSDSCSSGSRSPSCAWDEKQVTSGSSECGTCYKCQYNTDCNAYDNPCSGGWCNSSNSCGKCTSCGYPCSHSNHVSCSYGCASTCPCDSSCSSCKAGDDCKSYYYEEQSANGWCDFLNGGPKVIVCGKRKYCTTYSGSSKYISISYRSVSSPFYGVNAEAECQAAKGSGNNCN